VHGLGSDWQVVVSRQGLRDLVEIRVEVRAAAYGAEVERGIFRSLRERFPEMARCLAMGLCEARVTLHPVGSLRVGRKLRAIIDRRERIPSSWPADRRMPA